VPRFIDYHRTVVGYHGTRQSIALAIVQRRQEFEPSQNDSDWLGQGIYFWEHAPQQAWRWANQLKEKNRWNEPVAVLGSMIRLGYCFDLLDPANVKALEGFYHNYRETRQALGLAVPKNVRSAKRLDCAVFQYAYKATELEGKRIDSSRVVYVPTDNRKRVWPGSWIVRDAHIQICIRNPRCILGTWLVLPANEGGEGDAEETKQALPDPAGGQIPAEEVPPAAPGNHGEGGAGQQGPSGKGQA
jgi:hypothetical protein